MISLIIFSFFKSMTTDVCVPLSRLPEMLIQTKKDIDEMGITGKSIDISVILLVG